MKLLVLSALSFLSGALRISPHEPTQVNTSHQIDMARQDRSHGAVLTFHNGMDNQCKNSPFLSIAIKKASDQPALAVGEGFDFLPNVCYKVDVSPEADTHSINCRCADGSPNKYTCNRYADEKCTEKSSSNVNANGWPSFDLVNLDTTYFENNGVDKFSLDSKNRGKCFLQNYEFFNALENHWQVNWLAQNNVVHAKTYDEWGGAGAEHMTYVYASVNFNLWAAYKCQGR